MKVLSLLFCWLLLSLPAQAATEVIPLNFRSAAEMQNIVQSMLGDEGRVSSYGNQLIVNAPGERIQEIRALLAQLDTAPRRLLITVETSHQGIRDEQDYRADGTFHSGNTDIQLGQSDHKERNRIRIIRDSTNTQNGGSQQIQATEGYPALIQVGQSIPLETLTTTGGQVYRDIRYRDVSRGFYITANISGEQVQVTISARNDSLGQRSGVIDVQSLDTRLTGQLGQWIDVAGIDQQQVSSGSGLARRHSLHDRSDSSWRLKVERLD